MKKKLLTIMAMICITILASSLLASPVRNGCKEVDFHNHANQDIIGKVTIIGAVYKGDDVWDYGGSYSYSFYLPKKNETSEGRLNEAMIFYGYNNDYENEKDDRNAKVAKITVTIEKPLKKEITVFDMKDYNYNPILHEVSSTRQINLSFSEDFELNYYKFYTTYSNSIYSELFAILDQMNNQDISI